MKYVDFFVVVLVIVAVAVALALVCGLARSGTEPEFRVSHSTLT